MLYFRKEIWFFGVSEYIQWISTGEDNVEMYLEFKKQHRNEEILVKGPQKWKWERERGYKKGERAPLLVP